MEKFKDIRIKRRPHRTDRDGKITLDFTMYPIETDTCTREARGDYVTGKEVLNEKTINFTICFNSENDLQRFPDALPDSLFKRTIISECANITSSNGKPGKHKHDYNVILRIKKDSRWLYCFFQYWSKRTNLLPSYIRRIYDSAMPKNKIRNKNNIIWNSEHSILLTQYCLLRIYNGEDFKEIFSQKPTVFRRTYIDSDKKQFEWQTHNEIMSKYFENIPPEVVTHYPHIAIHTDETFNPLKKLLDAFAIPIP